MAMGVLKLKLTFNNKKLIHLVDLTAYKITYPNGQRKDINQWDIDYYINLYKYQVERGII